MIQTINSNCISAKRGYDGNCNKMYFCIEQNMDDLHLIKINGLCDIAVNDSDSCTYRLRLTSVCTCCFVLFNRLNVSFDLGIFFSKVGASPRPLSLSVSCHSLVIVIWRKVGLFRMKVLNLRFSPPTNYFHFQKRWLKLRKKYNPDKRHRLRCLTHTNGTFYKLNNSKL